jgi:hypothetical protein
MLIHKAQGEMWFGTRLYRTYADDDRMPSDEREWDRQITKRGVTILYNLTAPDKSWLSENPAATAFIRRTDRKALKSDESVADVFIVIEREPWTLAVFYHESRKAFDDAVRALAREDRYIVHTPHGWHTHKVYLRTREHLSLVEQSLARTGRSIVAIRPADDTEKITLDLNDKLAGIPYRVLRDYFGDIIRYPDYSLTVSGLENVFSLPTARTRALIRALLTEGLIEHDTSRAYHLDGRLVEKARQFKLSTKGHSLAGASTMPRMTRATIDKLVASVWKRALEVASDERFAMKFDMLGVFGSVMDSQAQDFGDLDVVYRLCYKPRWERKGDSSQWHRDIENFHVGHFPADDEVWSGRRFRGIRYRPLQHIRGRQGRISVHDESDLRHLEEKHPVPHRLLFGRRLTNG